MHDKHVQNMVAKVLREEWPVNHRNNAESRAAAYAHVSIALNFAKRFAEEDDSFDAPAWLDRCTPDSDLYPLSELWEVACQD